MLTAGATINVREQSKKRMKQEEKCPIRKTGTNFDSYGQKRIKTNRICRSKKKEWIERKIK